MTELPEFLIYLIGVIGWSIFCGAQFERFLVALGLCLTGITILYRFMVL